jgi:amino acid transporter
VSSRRRSRTVWRVLVGPPLRARESSKEEITSFEGLPALSLDALTSVAYGPEAILVVLAVAGAGALHLILPVTIAIVCLLGILVFSYRQVIDAYPSGGGAYAVSRANLGHGFSQLAAASLIVDYTLTVAVSIAAGVGALTSAFPSLDSLTVPICLGMLGVLTIANLRGLGESARAFLLPTVVFIGGLLAIIVVGLVHPLAVHAPLPGRPLVPTHGLEVVGILLVLKAFAAGCSALTGVEAIANGVPLFKKPRQRTAKRTEVLLGSILGLMLLGLAVLAVKFHIEPRSGQTVLSQIMGEAVGRHWAYYVVSLTITLVLALAANTSYGGLPVLASLLSRDNYLPHAFALRGPRQVFNYGIGALTLFSALLLVAVGGNTESLIPLFAIGVFIGFTLAQTGLVVHWWRTRPPRWMHRAALNATGAVMTGLSTIVFLVAKFTHGAFVVVIAVPLFILLFHRIHAYYHRVGRELQLGKIPKAPSRRRTTVIVPVTMVSKLTSQVLCEALSLGQEVIAVTVELYHEPPETDHVLAAPSEESGAAPPVARHHRDEPPHDPLTTSQQWERWNPGVPLQVLKPEYASVVDPIVAFVDKVRRQRDDQIVVLIPIIHPAKWRYRLLHNQIDLSLARALAARPDIVVARVRFELKDRPRRRRRRTTATGGSQ